MNLPSTSAATILIASDSSTDARLVQSLLCREFGQVVISTDPDRIADDVLNHNADVLVFAFNSVEKSEQYYLELLRISEPLHSKSRRAVVLCHKDEVQRAYELCRKALFDDYVLFWPMTLDAPRLPMAIHKALRELAVQARLVEQEKSYEQKTAEGRAHVASTASALIQVEHTIASALDRFEQHFMADGAHHASDRTLLAEIGQVLTQLKKKAFQPQFHEIETSLHRLKDWVEALSQQNSPATQTTGQADPVLPIVLVVDDDELQRKIVGQILKPENYRLVFAENGFEALDRLRTTTPDLILMDVMMPGIDGIETLKQIKVMPALEHVPVIMLTGRSEGPVVRESLKAGARDFVVKPFDRHTLINKLADLLSINNSKVI